MVSLYRHYDINSVLLYVGVSYDALIRLSSHRRTSLWYSQISRVEVEHYPNFAAALAAEKAAIISEKPIYNIAHNSQSPSKSPKDTVAITDAYIATFPLLVNARDKVASFYLRRYSINWIADFFGTEPAVIKHMVSGLYPIQGQIPNRAKPAFEHSEFDELSIHNAPASWSIPLTAEVC